MLREMVVTRWGTFRVGAPPGHNCPRKSFFPISGSLGSIGTGMHARSQQSQRFVDLSGRFAHEGGSPPNHALKRIGTAVRSHCSGRPLSLVSLGGLVTSG
jgi:hypothetical protein